MPLKMFQPPEQNRSHALKAAHIVAIAAGKGGVGKSSVTVNLALALRQAGYSVGLMDSDIYGPSIRRMLPEVQPPSQKGDRIYPAICHAGIRMISMAFFRRENEAAAVRAPIANGVIAQFINNVEWGPLDYLLIDFPPGTGDIQLTLAQQAHLTGALMVTTPQEVSLMDVRKAVHLFEQLNVPIVGIVENMSYYQHPATSEKIYIFGKGGGERLASEVGAPFLGCIPIDPEVCRCGDEGRSLLNEQHASSPAGKAFSELAVNMAAQVSALKSLSHDCLAAIDLQWKEMP